MVSEPLQHPHPRPRIIGWRETVALPDWGIAAMKAKIDTGARTSAIHVDRLQALPGNRVRFDVIVRHGRDGRRQTVPVEAEVVRMARVRPSTGENQERPVVKTRCRIGKFEREIEVSLVCRQGMLCRMLLGRKAIDGAFVVDPSRPLLLTKRRAARRRSS
jgi:hypothetical protein